MRTVEDFLRSHVLDRAEVDEFLDPGAPNWARFDPQLGYVLKDAFVRDGMDGAYTIGTFGPMGERTTINYSNVPCRMHAYGNSYTQCHQVGDAETWEEYLAGHLGEPVGNFGVGGYGVFQAFNRMRRVESTADGAGFILFNVFGSDDHHRSLDAWRRLRCGNWFQENPHMFHANPWGYVRFDLDTGELSECPSLCPTPESLYNLCDEDWVLGNLGRDLAVCLYHGRQPGAAVPRDVIEPAARFLDVSVDWSNDARRAAAIGEIHDRMAFRASVEILRRARAFCDGRGKKLMLLLSYGDADIHAACSGRPRNDARFLDAAAGLGVPVVDSLQAHVRDFADFRITPAQYTKRYCIPHYNPAGNHFFAFAIKDAVVRWLDPPPRTYPGQGDPMRFDDYLPGKELR